MKKLIFMLFLGTISLTSCNKQDVISDSSQIEMSENKIQSFSEDLSVALGILEQGDNLKVLFSDEGYDFMITDGRQNRGITLRKELCRGSGISFAKCVKNAVDEYGCVQITKDGDDYVGSDCP